MKVINGAECLNSFRESELKLKDSTMLKVLSGLHSTTLF